MSSQHRTGYSMPLSAPEYPPPPYRFSKISGANLLCRADAAALRSLVPPPLQPQPDHKVWIYAVELTIEQPLAVQYQEVGVFLPVMHGDDAGMFALILFLDQALPITVGREVWGFPKRAAEHISIDREVDHLAVELTHLGRPVLQWSFALTDESAQTVAEQAHRVFTHRRIPAPAPDEAPAIDELVELAWHTSGETRRRGVDVRFQADWSGMPQLEGLNDLQVLAAWYSDSPGCSLQSGRVVHRFR